MTPATRTDTNHKPCLRHNVIRNIVRTSRIPAHPCRHVVQLKIVPRSPGNVMVRTRGISAYTDATNQHFPCRRVKREPAAKYVHTANLTANHRVCSGAIVRRRSVVGDFCIHRITFLQTEKAASRLNGRIQIRR